MKRQAFGRLSPWHGLRYVLVIMDAEAPPSGRGRRILIALLILLLILLPLYLWPLRGGLGGPPGATALPASPLDPRSAAAVARIPDHVWDALMGRADAPAPGLPAPAPRNLTMIAQLDEPAGGELDPGVGESALSGSPASLARAMIAQFGGPSDLTVGNAEGDGSPATPGQFLAGPAGGPGTGNPWSGFALDGNLGPWNGGGPGGGSRLQIPGSTFDPGAPEPTPEPATLLLVGSNLALLGAAVWRRRRRGQESPSSG